jgi:hypothetical protein
MKIRAALTTGLALLATFLLAQDAGAQAFANLQ